MIFPFFPGIIWFIKKSKQCFKYNFEEMLSCIVSYLFFPFLFSLCNHDCHGSNKDWMGGTSCSLNYLCI